MFEVALFDSPQSFSRRMNAPPDRVEASTLVLICSLTALYILTGFAIRQARAPYQNWLDPDEIGQIGSNLCKRGEFAKIPGQATMLRGPAYPAILALPCWLTGMDALTTSPVANGICHFLTLWILASHPLASKGRNRLIAILCVGLDPLLLNYSGRTYLEPMLIMTIAMVIAATDWLVRKPGPRSALALGLAWGLSLLTKPVLIYLPVVLIPVLFLLRRRSACFGIASVVVGLLAIVPWSYRNLTLTGRFLPVATGAWKGIVWGEAFADVDYSRDGIVSLDARAAENLAAVDRTLGIENLPLHERETHYQAYFLETLRTHPERFVRKVLAQSVSFWILGGRPRNTLLFATLQLPVLCLFVLAAVRCFRKDPQLLLGLAVVGTYTMGIYAVSLANARYSMPLRPWLVLTGVVFLVERLFARRTETVAPPRA